MNDLKPAEVPEAEIVPVEQGIYDMPVAAFRDSLARRGENRRAVMEWVRNALVDGVDFGQIEVRGRMSKPSLWKPGAEKICGMLGLTATFPNAKDYEQKALRGEKIETILLRCELLSQGGRVVGEGMGARTLEQNKGDLNAAFKMAEKSALIDATLRAGGLSEVFTQDIEDMAHQNGKKEHPIDSRPPLPAANPAAAGLQEAWDESKTQEAEKTDGKGVIAAIMVHLNDRELLDIGGDPAEVFRLATGVATMKGASLVQLQGYLKLVEEYAKKKAGSKEPEDQMLQFGKFKGSTLSQLASNEVKDGRSYLGWIINKMEIRPEYAEENRRLKANAKWFLENIQDMGDEPPEQHPLDGQEGVPF